MVKGKKNKKIKRKLYKTDIEDLFYVKLYKHKIHLYRYKGFSDYDYEPLIYFKSIKAKNWKKFEERLKEITKSLKCPVNPEDFVTKGYQWEIIKDYKKSGGFYFASKYFPYLLKIGNNLLDFETKSKILSLLINSRNLKINGEKVFIKWIDFTKDNCTGFGLCSL
jgi:hypothetical protein